MEMNTGRATSPSQVYERRAEQFTVAGEAASSKERMISHLRVLAFSIAAAALITGMVLGIQWVSALSLPALASFAVLVMKHRRLRARRLMLDTLAKLQHRELGFLSSKWPEVDTGDRFSDETHPYVADLDIFGAASLFAWLNRGETELGKRCLADWLSEAASPEEARRRQHAATELSTALDFRQRLQAHGRIGSMRPGDERRVEEMLTQISRIMGKRLPPSLKYILPAVLVTLFALTSIGLSWTVPLGACALSLGINLRLGRLVSVMHSNALGLAGILRSYAVLFHQVERRAATTTLLQELRASLTAGKATASERITRLSRLLELLDQRRNAIFYIPLNIVFMLDLHLLSAIDAWRREAGERINSWFQAIGQLEAVSSLATLTFNNPDWTTPSFSAQTPVFKAESLGHPLIPVAARVCNDVSIQEPGSILLLTGPNMSGKSTFLRTLGVNMVLARAGARACATQLTMAPRALLASMRAIDSLDRNMSLFYAELSRIKLIINAAGARPVVFLIDEVLKGTNMTDRRKGATALIRQLNRLGAAGIVATHDMELTGMEQELPGAVINIYTDGHVEGEKLLFDYKVRPGVCVSTNAVELMKRIGIEL